MRDETKRAKVRKLLRTKRGREMTDRQAAREAGVGRYLVGSVRRELIAAGVIPVPEASATTAEGLAARMYQPGTSVRGGYVWDELGKPVREVVWLKRQKAKARAVR